MFFRSNSYLLQLAFLILLALASVFASEHHGYQHHGSHKHLHPRSSQDENFQTAGPGNKTLSGPEDIVRSALAALSVVNKARVEHPLFNKFEFDSTPGSIDTAPPLEYGNATLSKRSSNGTSSSDVVLYSIPTELADAARVLAEATEQLPVGNHSDVAAAIRKKYSSKLNDTNAPEALDRPEGLLGTFGPDTSEITARATYGYWMADIKHQAFAPYAPSGYKVWRDVKEYGAKGDGVTDDTAAINKAISDGSRCGNNCGSSTTTPAVVWFPPGTYLVSSSIIQYYNTQFLGDPHQVPVILAAKSFVGLGVITSDVYTGENQQWYVNQNNFLRSIKNFVIDIRLTDPSAYICGIHWQVAQGTSLENIVFYMIYNTDNPSNTQQGIYMENGSGGFLADLTFVGGNFGAYFGNQQFTTSNLVFTNCDTAIQLHWDWAWTMQGFVIESCTNGLTVTGGAGGLHSTGQSVGSLILVDSLIANTVNGIITSLLKENSTSLLLQNVGFFNVKTAVQDAVNNKVLIKGGDQQVVDSWGFGQISDQTGKGSFSNGNNIPAMNRTQELVTKGFDKMKPNLFTRRRPKYYDVPVSQIMDVKALGAKGDGTSDDTAVLNAILDGAANTTSIVYFPYGVYLVTDTLRIPIGSRIIGQAWSQIMASGPKFQDELRPRAAVQVGRPGDVGIIEIQDMLFTVSGPTAGAVVVEWNAHEGSQGSVGLWDSHIRVGGGYGSLLRYQCPKLTGKINPSCKAASLLMHMTPQSTGYLENVWIWVADHDMEVPSQDQIDVYAGRGLLVQSQKAWLWGTSVEHAVLYQYQLSGAKNIFMGMIQTESPYFQPTPNAPQPFRVGMFPDDPTFANCASDPKNCAKSWAVRIVDSSTVYILGAGLYSWFTDYTQGCVDTNNCQARGFEVQQSNDLWVYNLCTKAIVEMVSPLGGVPTYARDNVNGFLSSVLAWLQGAQNTAGKRKFRGFQLYTSDDLDDYRLPSNCKAALTQKILCDDYVQEWTDPMYHGSLGNITLTDSVCDTGCNASLKSYFGNAQNACAGYNISNTLPEMLGGRLWAGYNETCLKSIDGTNRYCNDLLDSLPTVSSIQKMSKSDLCRFCNTERIAMMQRTPFSTYDDFWKSQLDYIYSQCGITGSTAIPKGPITFDPKPPLFCLSKTMYTTRNTESCDSIALPRNISSAALYMTNQQVITNCSSIPTGTQLCLPLSCQHTYVLQPKDSCSSIEQNNYNATLGFEFGDLTVYNPWISSGCDNLQISSTYYGHVLCLSPQNGRHNLTGPGSILDTTIPSTSDGYTTSIVSPPAGAKVAQGTTKACGKWHTATSDDSCASICFGDAITIALFLAVNPSLGTTNDGCDGKLIAKTTYCTGPNYSWNS